MPGGRGGNGGRATFPSFSPQSPVVAAWGGGDGCDSERAGQWGDNACLPGWGGPVRSRTLLFAPPRLLGGADKSAEQQVGQQEASSSQQTLAPYRLLISPPPPAPGPSFLSCKLSETPRPQNEAYAPLVKVGVIAGC